MTSRSGKPSPSRRRRGGSQGGHVGRCASPLHALFPDRHGLLSGAEEIAKPLVKFDLAKAKQILEEAGWKDSGKGYREKGGQPLEVNFLAFNIARYKRMAEVATPMLQAAGFKVDLKILEPGDLYERVLKGEHHLLATGMVDQRGGWPWMT